MAALYPPAPLEERFLHVPYDQRWEALKPVIVGFYLGTDGRPALKYPELKQAMAQAYGFTAETHQYRYHITKKWKITKRVTTVQKIQLASVLGKRARSGVTTSDITIAQGDGEVEKQVDRKKLRRFLNQEIKNREQQLRLLPGVLSSWSQPPSSMFPVERHEDQPSPLPSVASTPSSFVIASPAPNGDGRSPVGISPTTQLAQKELFQRRTNLLIQGLHGTLIQKLKVQERIVLGSYLHDFWMHAFVTAKYWGKGPKEWTPYLIEWKTLKQGIEYADTPGTSTSSAPSPLPANRYHAHSPPTPSQLCRWSIHYECPIEYEHVESPPRDPDVEEKLDLDNDSTWPAWQQNELDMGIAAKLQDALEENSFTKAPLNEVPISISSLGKVARKSPQEMEAESFAFMIMAGNVEGLNEGWGDLPPRLTPNIYPFHLAASYLDGSRTCCLMMDFLCNLLEDEDSIGACYKNDNGHTVLDYIFLKILVSHTSVHPSTLSDVFRESGNFPGEDRDICGRWDYDSPCVRHHHQSGQRALPFEWKHPFCHTAVQAICHSIISIFLYLWSPDTNTPSGLFRSNCPVCRCDLSLLPLHLLVVVTFHLANSGCEGETLFGSLAVLTCLVSMNADPTLTADVPISSLLGLKNDGSNCQHESLLPIDLAARVPQTTIESWRADVRLGWEVFTKALQEATDHRRLFDERQERTENDSMNSEEEDSDTAECNCWVDKEKFPQTYCSSRYIGTLWAAIQAEFLTYRRINVADPWLSKYFDMEAILERGPKSLPLIRDGMTTAFHRCGRYQAAVSTLHFPHQEHVCSFHFMNMDDYTRTSFIDPIVY